MTDNSKAAARPVRVAFLNCHDATLFCDDVSLTAAEELRVAALVDWLADAGVMLRPKPSNGAAAGMRALLEHLRRTVGAALVEAGLAADPARPASSGGGPVAVMPVWAFAAEGDDAADRDVLLSSGRLWGADVLIEGLRVDGPDEGLPVRSVRSRYDRWLRAAGGGCQRVAVQPPGEPGWYVLSALSAPA